MKKYVPLKIWLFRYAIGAVVLIVILLTWGELHARQRFSLVEKDITKVSSELLTPRGAEEIFPRRDQDGKWTFGVCLYYTCRELDRTWYMLVERGMELDLAMSILQVAGYSLDGSITAEECQQDLAKTNGRCDITGKTDKNYDSNKQIWVSMRYMTETEVGSRSSEATKRWVAIQIRALPPI